MWLDKLHPDPNALTCGTTDMWLHAIEWLYWKRAKRQLAGP